MAAADLERRSLARYADLAFSDVANDGASWNLSFCCDAPTPQSGNAKVASIGGWGLPQLESVAVVSPLPTPVAEDGDGTVERGSVRRRLMTEAKTMVLPQPVGRTTSAEVQVSHALKIASTAAC